ncbi:helix-turn-helix domain-containing protein [Ectothiorhodospira lacustris]|uniref:helix-turn-helix domain-containing protein n=1 Tax=Ectothiorhodospira lacustris TaxID=2899127 RepID=UPI001EE7DCA0|nr:PAS domain-containing protein [Ectothiorhodospira lacustris]MCG5510609.1 PAS domain-containing protein [Ectothiorhodospira lacustris]MCG5521301.1 PAS domain-containing protein [Ectothiorhodospira lacustris]
MHTLGHAAPRMIMAKPENPTDQGVPDDAAYRALFSASPAALLLLEPDDMRVLDASHGACALLGRPIQDVVGIKPTHWAPGRPRQLVRMVEQAVTEGQAGTQALEIGLVDGALLEVNCSIRAVTVQKRKLLLVALGEASEPREKRTEATAAAEEAQKTHPVLTEAERRERDRQNIIAALEACHGKVFGRSGAAELLGIPATTLASRIKAMGITQVRQRKSTHKGKRCLKATA